MMMPMFNNSLNKTRQGWVKYKDILDGQFSEEFIVTFSTSKGLLTAIFPSSFIDKDKGAVSVFVIGEEKDLFLVDLPNYTFTTGSKAWFPKKAVSLEGSLV